jgi:N-formylglutamate amidohydrolase
MDVAQGVVEFRHDRKPRSRKAAAGDTGRFDDLFDAGGEQGLSLLSARCADAAIDVQGDRAGPGDHQARQQGIVGEFMEIVELQAPARCFCMRTEQALASMITGMRPLSEAFISGFQRVRHAFGFFGMPLLASIWPQHSLSKPSGRIGRSRRGSAVPPPSPSC